MSSFTTEKYVFGASLVAGTGMLSYQIFNSLSSSSHEGTNQREEWSGLASSVLCVSLSAFGLLRAMYQQKAQMKLMHKLGGNDEAPADNYANAHGELLALAQQVDTTIETPTGLMSEAFISTLVEAIKKAIIARHEEKKQLTTQTGVMQTQIQGLEEAMKKAQKIQERVQELEQEVIYLKSEIQRNQELIQHDETTLELYETQIEKLSQALEQGQNKGLASPQVNWEEIQSIVTTLKSNPSSRSSSRTSSAHPSPVKPTAPHPLTPGSLAFRDLFKEEDSQT